MGLISFFRSLFSGGWREPEFQDSGSWHEPENQIVPVQKEGRSEDAQLVEYLKNNIVISDLWSTPQELERQGYKKLSTAAGALFSQFPGMMGTALSANSYRINFPPGFSVHDLMRLNRNGELTTILKKAGKGAIQGTASLVSNGPAAIVMGVFTVLSIITSQYFLAEINGKLEKIKGQLSRIDLFIRLEKMHELYSGISYLNEVYRDYEYIISSPVHQQAVLTNIIQLKRDADRDIMFYSNMIEDTFNRLNNSTKKGIIEESLNSIAENISCLKYAVMIYSVASVFEPILAGNHGNMDYLNNIENSMESRQKIFTENMTRFLGRYDQHKQIMTDKWLLRRKIEKGKFDPDSLFGRDQVEQDISSFCGQFVNSMNTLKAYASKGAEYAICNNEAYIRMLPGNN